MQRLGPPHWPAYPPGRAYGAAAADDPLAAARAGAARRAADRARSRRRRHQRRLPAGARRAGARRARHHRRPRLWRRPATRSRRSGGAAAEGLLAGGVLPVIKHMPGHGRARADSHQALPVVETPLRRAGSARFRAVPGAGRHAAGHDRPCRLHGHRPEAAGDDLAQASIRQIIRGSIGFDGLLMSDDLSMKALAGSIARAGRVRPSRPAATSCCTATASWRRWARWPRRAGAWRTREAARRGGVGANSPCRRAA